MNDTPADGRAPLRRTKLTRRAPGFGWRRVVLLRRVAAGALAATALLLAVRDSADSPDSREVLVAVHDLAPGSTVHGPDIALRRWPSALVPARALVDPAQVEGRVLAGAAAGGEPLTELRFAGPGLAKQATGDPEAASVPIRLADADVAGLLGPGQRVDVVTVGERTNQPTVLATGAMVLTVLPPDSKGTGGKGRLVVVAVPKSLAAKLAAATLSQEVTVTLR